MKRIINADMNLFNEFLLHLEHLEKHLKQNYNPPFLFTSLKLQTVHNMENL